MKLRPLRLLLPLFALFTAIPGNASAIGSSELKTSLGAQMAAAGAYSGAYAVDLSSGKELFAWKSDVRRIPASVEKLYTTSTVLLKDGPAATLKTRVLASGTIDSEGVLKGDLFLEGSGDPTFGSETFARRAFGSDASVDALAAQIVDSSGITKVKGHVYGDESAFDQVRGVPDSGWAISGWVGPLSGLAFNRDTKPRGGFQTNPAKTAAQALTDALQKAGITVTNASSTGDASKVPDTKEVASVDSPPLSKIAALTNKPSDNFLAEMLLKGLGARYGASGSTTAGASVVKTQLAQVGAYPQVVDGSGLSRANRTSPRQVVAALKAVAAQPSFAAFKSSLSIAGRDGTLAKRMRGTAAKGRCRAKTGTLSNVSSLAGYCDAAAGHIVAFAIMMNATSPYSARKVQDRMAAAMAKFDGQ